jgi:hypothetical protein
MRRLLQEKFNDGNSGLNKSLPWIISRIFYTLYFSLKLALQSSRRISQIFITRTDIIEIGKIPNSMGNGLKPFGKKSALLSSPKAILVFLILGCFVFSKSEAQQVSSDGCVVAGFGIDAGLYSGIVEYGAGVEPVSPRSNDWFLGAAGRGIIDESNTATLKTLLQTPNTNPLYTSRMKYGLVSKVGGQILIDGVFARDYFGGTGFRDQTTYLTASKNGEDPAIWDPGEMNVLGKNDIIDAGGHMFRDGEGLTSNLWFVGLFNMAEPGGTAYMDFEFYVNSISVIPRAGGGIKFTSGGPQLGHTAYTFSQGGNITKIGDFIFSVALSGQTTVVETRLWVSYADWIRLNGATMGSTPTFTWAGTYDGAFNGSPYGYAGIVPLVSNPVQICGYVNNDVQTPIAPPWGTKGTKTNSWGTKYIPNSVAEVGINLTALGMDHSSLSGVDPCYFPLNTFIIKTRASDSFTAQLKDFSGPYSWGQPNFTITSDFPVVSCDNEVATLTANPSRDDVGYVWTTVDGNIISNPNLGVIQVNKPGTYHVTVTLPNGCPTQSTNYVVGYDAAKPFFNEPPQISSTISCNGNDGSITVSATGATPPYTYTWTKDGNPFTVTSSPTISGLAPGSYEATIKGVYACVITTGAVVIPGRIPVVITPTITDVTCNGIKDGSINLNISGGKTPLSYLWSTGNTSQNLLNIGAGEYTVIVTDADGCITNATFDVNQPPALAASIAKNDDTDPDLVLGTGTANLTPSGGTSPYTFTWVASETGTIPSGQANNQNLTLLDYGKYTVTITDSNGCTTTASVFIFQPEVCNDSVDNDGDGLNNCDDSDCIPVTPENITPSTTTPCVGSPLTYTVPLNTNYDSYQWSVPANATINEGQGTNEIEVIWNTTAGGQICVRGKKFDCLSAPICITVSVNDIPPAAEILL